MKKTLFTIAIVFLCGTSFAQPVVSFSPVSINFPLQLIGTQSAPTTVTLTNTGTATLVISNLATTAEFVRTSTTCGGTLNAGASCTTGVAFAPTGGGTRTGILQLIDNASGSPHSVALSGPGLVPGVVIQGNVEMTGNFSMSVATGGLPGMSIVPSSLNFGASPIGSVNTLALTVTNTGVSALLFSSITLADTSNYSETDNCTSLLATQACTVNVTFSPDSVATLNTTLTIVANDSGSPHAVTILGSGIAVGGDLPFPNFALQGGVAFLLPQVGVDPMVYSTQAVQQSVYIGNSTCPLAPSRTNYLGVSKGSTVCDFADSNGTGLQTVMNDWASGIYGDQRWDVIVTHGSSFNFGGTAWTWKDKYSGLPTVNFLVFHSDTPNPRGRTVCSHGIQDVLTPPLPDAGQRNHRCIGFLGFPAAIPGAQMQQPNADDTLTLGPTQLFENARLTQSYLGWSLCVKPGCDPGGTGTPAATSQTINNASPSQDGASMLFSLTSGGACIPSGCNTNALWVDKVGIDDSLTTFQSDFWVYPVDANAAQREFDNFQFSVTENREYMLGVQCNITGSGKWEVFNQGAGTWNATPTNCSGATGLPVGSWTHVVLNQHRVPGDTNEYYDSIVINGSTTTWNISYPSGVLPSGWQSANGFQFQFNVAATNTTTAQYIDLAKFTASRAASNAAIPVTDSAYTFDPTFNDLAKMWTITSTASGTGSVIKMGPASTTGDPFGDCGGPCPTDGVNHIIMQDAKILPASSVTISIVPVGIQAAEWIGNSGLSTHYLPAAPHDIGFDENYFTADADDDGFGTNAINNHIQFACAKCWFNHNYADAVKRDGAEDHVLNLSNAPGPVQANHNWLEGGSIALWGGGGSLPSVVGLLTTNIERRRNRLTYNQRWLPPPAGLQPFSKGVTGGSCSGGNTLVLNIPNTGSNIIANLVVYLKTITGVGTIANQWYTATSINSTAVTLATTCTNGTVSAAGSVYGFSSNAVVTSAAAMNGKATSDPKFANPVAKNRSENKEGQSTIEDGEILENCGADGQSGFCLLVSVRACGGVSWCAGGQSYMISDWASTNNIFRHGNQAFQISARSGGSNNRSWPVTAITCAADGNSAAITATGLNAGISAPNTDQTVYGTDVYLASIGNGVISGTPLLANGFYATAYPTNGNYAVDSVVTVKGTAICPANDTTAAGLVYGPDSNNGAGVTLPGRRYVFQNNLIYDMGDHSQWDGGGSVTFVQNGAGNNNYTVNMTVTQVSPVVIVNAAVQAINACPVSQLCPKVLQAAVGDYAYIQCLNDNRFSTGGPKTKGVPILSVAGDQLSFTYTPQNGSPALTLSDTTSCPLAPLNSSIDSGYYNGQSFPWPSYWNHNTGVGVNFFVNGTGGGGFIKYSTYQNSLHLIPGTGDVAPANGGGNGGGFRCNNSDVYSGTDATGITFCNDRPTFTYQRYVMAARAIANNPNFLAGVTCAPSCSQDPAINPNTNSAPARVSTPGTFVTCGGVACDSSHFIPDSVGISGSMGTSNYPLNLTDWRTYSLHSSSPYKAGGPLQATDGKDLGVQMSLIINAQNRTLYPCPLSCGTGLFHDGPSYGWLTWSASSDPGLLEYRVYRDGGGTAVAHVTTTYFTDYGLASGAHTWIVKAWNGSSETTVSGLTSVIY